MVGKHDGVAETPHISTNWRAFLTGLARVRLLLDRHSCPSFFYQTIETIDSQKLEFPRIRMLGKKKAWCHPQEGLVFQQEVCTVLRPYQPALLERLRQCWAGPLLDWELFSCAQCSHSPQTLTLLQDPDEGHEERSLDIFVTHPSVATLNKSPFSGFHY